MVSVSNSPSDPAAQPVENSKPPDPIWGKREDESLGEKAGNQEQGDQPPRDGTTHAPMLGSGFNNYLVPMQNAQCSMLESLGNWAFGIRH